MTHHQKIELLAPAGNLDSFYAAIQAGADAVYLGTQDFNARLRAKNFTVKTLSYLIPYAHARSVKIYAALNILNKQNELERILHLLYQFSQIKMDAVIIQDLGLLRIIKNHFPALPVHASTQMLMHNSLSLKQCKKMGIKRVILSRELTLKEIAAIREKTDLELEVFAHGALCYSISGACLASSYLGGKSGNRGLCTQVCRRSFMKGHESGYYFSPKDFCTIEMVPQYISMRITSLKIEGRMKNAEYVYQIVSAYRKALNTPSLTSSLRKELEHDLGSREKTSFFLKGQSKEAIIVSDRPLGIGWYLGQVTDANEEEIGILFSSLSTVIHSGDWIRIHPQDGSEGRPYQVIHVSMGQNNPCRIRVKDTSMIGMGDHVYLTGKKSIFHKFKKKNRTRIQPVFYKPVYPWVKKVLRKEDSFRLDSNEELIIQISHCGWLGLLTQIPFQGMILDFEKDLLHEFLENRIGTLSMSLRSKCKISLPPFIPEEEISGWKNCIELARKNGIRKWVCNQIGQRSLFDGEVFELTAGSFIPVMNDQAQRMLKENGFTCFFYSFEDDFLNLKKISHPSGLFSVFTRVRLFVSRIRPALNCGITIRDNNQNLFQVHEKHGLYYLVSETPLCLTHQKEKVAKIGIKKFVLDLSFFQPDEKFLSDVIGAYQAGTRLHPSTMFNFKTGLA
ncbi:MAG: U32 family peptidase [Candidatus Aureabacteria bacterium]|nr:U32 family peptidase [Candidatus Auribacterota bacterium]